MTYEEFVRWIAENLKEELKEEFADCQIMIARVEKPQNGSYLGIRVQPKESVLAMGIDLRKAYKEYERHHREELCLWQTAEKIRENFQKHPRIRVEDVKDFDKVKNKITIQLVSTKRNQRFLETVPHREWEDLSIIYRIILEEEEMEAFSMVITNELMKIYGITEEELYDTALREAPLNFPAEIYKVRNVLAELGDFWNIMFAEASKEGDEMIILTANDGFMGASSVFYPELLEKLVQIVGGSFFVLPSSIHEMILVRDNGAYKGKHLRELVREINRVEIPKEDFLSDSVYYYHAGTKLFIRMQEDD